MVNGVCDSQRNESIHFSIVLTSWEVKSQGESLMERWWSEKENKIVR